MSSFEIAGMLIKLDFDIKDCNKMLDKFSVCDENRNIDILCKLEDYKDLSNNIELLIKADTFAVYRQNDNIIFEYYEKSYIKYCKLQINDGICTIGVSAGCAYETYIFAEEVFYSIRDVFFALLQKRNILTIHSSSIIYNDQVYLFSASSGTGKTTHTNFWTHLYGTEIFNGDVAAVGIKEENIVAYGLPWCGSSGQSQNLTMPVGGIFMLKRGLVNKVTVLDEFNAVVNLTARSFSPSWTSEMLEKNILLAEHIVKRVTVAQCDCCLEESSAVCVKNYIDKNHSVC